MRRVLVIGSGGAGKSTVARTLGTQLGLPVIHLDAHYWRPGWVPTPAAEWRERVAQLAAGDSWVMDGHYGGTMEQRLSACDTVVFLDLPWYVCLSRVLQRTARYRGRSRPDMTDGCPEHLTWDFAWWIITYPIRRRPGVLARLAALPDRTRVVRLRSTRDVETFMRDPAAYRRVYPEGDPTTA